MKKIGLFVLLIGVVLLIIALTRKPGMENVIYESTLRDWKQTNNAIKYTGIGLILVGGILTIVNLGKSNAK